jgi:uncharacterized protein (TIGR00255 family)
MVRSMTGYGRCEIQTEKKDIQIELRAVNHRYFEFSLRIPKMYLFLEDKIKNYIQSKIKRGKVDVFVTIIDKSGDGTDVVINDALAKGYFDALNTLSETFDIKNDVNANILARFPEVLSVNKEAEDEDEMYSLILPALSGAVDDFISMREREGLKLKEDVLSCAKKIEDNVNFVEEHQEDATKEYFEKLKSKLTEILENKQIDEQRIVTEAAIFADKTATAEETVRLKSHLSQIRSMLELDEPIGRKLDFIIQECNREANTIGSKCQNLDITKKVVEIKSEIEKIREQIQNIE